MSKRKRVSPVGVLGSFIVKEVYKAILNPDAKITFGTVKPGPGVQEIIIDNTQIPITEDITYEDVTDQKNISGNG